MIDNNARHLLYLIGQPGVGKSTLLRAALGRPTETRTSPVVHMRYGRTGMQLGAERPGTVDVAHGIKKVGYSGTDALPYNVLPAVLAWLTLPTFPYRYVAAEGARLSNDRFFQALVDAGWGVTVALLSVPNDVADARCYQRGSRFSPSWVAGVRTQTDRLAERWCTPAWTLDTTQPLTTLVAHIATHPVVAGIRAARVLTGLPLRAVLPRVPEAL